MVHQMSGSVFFYPWLSYFPCFLVKYDNGGNKEKLN